MNRRKKLACTLSALLAVASLGVVAAATDVAGANDTHNSAIKRSMPNGKTDVIKVM